LPKNEQSVTIRYSKKQGVAMTDTPIPEVTLEQVLQVLAEQNGNLQRMAQYFFDLGHSEGEQYMADKIHADETN